MSLTQLLQLKPEYRDYLWGGQRLRPGQLTAEAWVVYENDRIASGPFAGRTLAEVSAELGASLLGQRAFQQTGARFPLLIKLLDCAQWLSLQVHPNDEQAARLQGPGFFGKTEAWHVLEAAPDAQLIAGLEPGTTAEAAAQSIRDGTILDWSHYVSAQAGDTIFMRPGTIHALGPGLMIYEVQQTSDLTYRVFDWNRPQTEKRKLHIEKSLQVVDPTIVVEPKRLPSMSDGDRQVLVACPYFTLEMLAMQSHNMELDTRGETFHALTVIQGAVRIAACDGSLTLGCYESVVVPATCGAYRLEPLNDSRLLKSSVEPPLAV